MFKYDFTCLDCADSLFSLLASCPASIRVHTSPLRGSYGFQSNPEHSPDPDQSSSEAGIRLLTARNQISCAQGKGRKNSRESQRLGICSIVLALSTHAKYVNNQTLLSRSLLQPLNTLPLHSKRAKESL
jgi:hypothetical protein